MKNIEICWNITSQCNQGCKYCHRFLNIENLNYEKNVIILEKLINSKVGALTWTGGEALLLPYLDKLLRKSYECGIKNKLITNGKLLTRERLEKIHKYLNVVNLSLDSISDEINEKIGRGQDHFNTIKKRIDLLEHYNVGYNINTVLNRTNINDMIEFSNYVSNLKINEWRIFKFMPLRELSIKTRDLFDIPQEDFDTTINVLKMQHPNLNIITREINDFEKLYLLILANGDVFITKNGMDVRVGNLLNQHFDEIINTIGETS